MCGRTGQVVLVDGMDFADPKMLDFVMQDCNVVINLLASRKHARDEEHIRTANVDIAIQIAKAVERNNIKRFIHFSSAGADEDSISLNLKTKAVAEKIIRDIHPDTTIFRPCTIYSRCDDFLMHFKRIHGCFGGKFFPVTDDCTALR